jgi:predicted Zn-dependent protease
VVRAALALTLLLAACADPAPLPDLEPGQRPAPGSEEAGLWMQADRAEESIRTSSLRITDPALVAYVQGIVDRVAGPRAGDLRLYLLRAPEFNAFAFPNGALVVLSGLILRAENESQLAFVLGHEIAHYQRRHAVLIYLSARSKSSFAAFFQTIANAAMVGSVGTMVGNLAMGSAFRFNRDQERDADEGGFAGMAKAGYDPREAAKICEVALHETEASGQTDRSSFFSSHPTTRERIKTLTARAEGASAPPVAAGTAALAQVLLPHRLGFLRDEVRRNEPASLQILLDRLFREGARPGELHFIQGELYRLRRQRDDSDKAISAYRTSLDHAPAPPEAHQMLGILYLKKGDKELARTSLTKYLELRPQSEDAEMVKSYLKQLE